VTVETQLAASEMLQATFYSNGLGAKFGHYSKKNQRRKEAEVFVAQAQPL
jgi:hypothetical protein